LLLLKRRDGFGYALFRMPGQPSSSCRCDDPSPSWFARRQFHRIGVASLTWMGKAYKGFFEKT
jgi:hypothetical protein